VTQPYDPSYTTAPPPGGYTPPPADDGAYLHPHQRTVLWVARAITYVLYAYIIAVEVILFLGFILLLGGANAGSSFVDWCYRNLERVMQPFRGIFEPVELGTAGSNEVASVFDASIVFAMLIYAIVGIVIYGLASWLTKRLYRLDVEDREYHARVAREREAYLQQVTAYQIAAAQNADAQRAVAMARTAAATQSGPAPQVPTPAPAPAPPPAPTVPPTADDVPPPPA
jgi:hypothetical protein